MSPGVSMKTANVGLASRFVLCALLVTSGAQAPIALAQSEVEGENKKPGHLLAERQAIVRDRVERLEDRMFQLAQALQKAEPKKAGRLMEGLGALRGRLIREQVGDIVEMLKSEQYADAVDVQHAVAQDLQDLLKLLMEDPDNLKERKEAARKLSMVT